MTSWYDNALSHIDDLEENTARLKAAITSDTLTPERLDVILRSHRNLLEDTVTCVHRQWETSPE